MNCKLLGCWLGGGVVGLPRQLLPAPPFGKAGKAPPRALFGQCRKSSCKRIWQLLLSIFISSVYPIIELQIKFYCNLSILFGKSKTRTRTINDGKSVLSNCVLCQPWIPIWAQHKAHAEYCTLLQISILVLLSQGRDGAVACQKRRGVSVSALMHSQRSCFGGENMPLLLKS